MQYIILTIYYCDLGDMLNYKRTFNHMLHNMASNIMNTPVDYSVLINRNIKCFTGTQYRLTFTSSRQPGGVSVALFYSKVLHRDTSTSWSRDHSRRVLSCDSLKTKQSWQRVTGTAAGSFLQTHAFDYETSDSLLSLLHSDNDTILSIFSPINSVYK